MPPGTYRKITGNEAIALGLVAAAQLAGKPLVYSGYPITPGVRHPGRAVADCSASA